MYVFITDPVGSAHIVEFTMAGATPNLATRRRVVLVPHPTYDNHNGGELMIGRDNLLYIGLGDDGGSRTSATGWWGFAAGRSMEGSASATP
jgi:glucose/arabinose dehydrogenase